MVIIHIANINSLLLGGVQIAVPQMVRAQAKHASVGLINTHGDAIEGVKMLPFDKGFNCAEFEPPFNSPDIVVFHEIYRFEFIKMYKQVRAAGVPYIIVPHGSLSRQAQRRKWLKKTAANILFFAKYVNAAAFIQYLSQNERAMSAFPSCHSFVCGNGISIPQKKKSSFFENGVKMIYIGRLEIKTKGLDLLLQAVYLCKDQMRQANVKLEIYGPDYNGEHSELRKIINEFNIADIVSIGREKTGIEKEEFLLSADCFIQTSRTEGMPMGPIEALSYGLPCIVTRGVGLGQIIESGGAGYHCETTAESIAEAICLFINNKGKIANISKAAIDVAKNNFDIDAIAEQTEKEYRKIAKQFVN